MEKDQMDSLATVAVGSEKIPPPPHSHYAPSEVYSSSEVPPPAYSRPGHKSTAVQIARIIATTLIAMSVIIGCFILAAAWLQARASCTPESIAAMQAQLAIQQPESLRRLQPEALVQEPIVKESLQQIEKEQPEPTKESKSVKDDADNTKTDNESGDENENDEDYDDPEFPPVHIKLPLQLDLDDLAGTIMQQARSLVSCVVERRRSDDLPDNSLDANSTDPKRLRLGSERVAIICESGEPRRQEQQEQELLTPLIVPLGPLPLPMQSQEQDYHRYNVPNDNQRPQINFRLLHPMNAAQNPQAIPQMMDMLPPQRMQPRPQPMDMRPVPIDLRPLPVEAIHGMRPPSDQEQQHHFFPQEQNNYHQDQQPQGMVPPPPPPPPQQQSQELPQEHRMMPQVIIRQQVEQRQPEESQERPVFPFAREFQGIPLEIRRIIQQVPLEIKNIIQHITGEGRPTPVPEGARREPVQEFKPFPEPSMILPIEVRNLLEHGNIEGRRQESAEEQEQAKPFPGPEDQGEEEEKRFGVPPHIRNFIQQVVEGRGFPVPRMALPIRAGESFEVPMEVSARVIGVEDKEQQNEEQQTGQQQMHQVEEQGEDEDKRPHFVQPRSVRSARSVPEAFHTRTKRSRKCECACDC